MSGYKQSNWEKEIRDFSKESEPLYENEMDGYDVPLTDAQERYCQLRAEGFTKTKAAKIAYPDTKHPGKYGHIVERLLKIRERIIQLKDERKEVSENLSLEEQIRNYQDIHQMCLAANKPALAMKALERLDMLLGYDIKRSESRRIVDKPVNPLDNGDELDAAFKKFSTILGTHGARPKHQDKENSSENPADTVTRQ